MRKNFKVNIIFFFKLIYNILIYIFKIRLLKKLNISIYYLYKDYNINLKNC